MRSGTDTTIPPVQTEGEEILGREFQGLPITKCRAMEMLLKDLAGFPIPGFTEFERGENALLMLTEYQQRARRLLTPARGEHPDEAA